jgi:hypothetical protein
MSAAAPPACVGIAGVNTRPLHDVTMGIAGNWGSTLRPHLEHITAGSTVAADHPAWRPGSRGLLESGQLSAQLHLLDLPR